MKKILSYKNVSFKRDGREILKNINWEIKEGENWALIGLNGSGKSTLLSMIPAYTFATKGEVSVFDKKFGTCVWAEIKEKVGFVSSTLNNFSDRLNNQSLMDIVLSGKYNSIGIYQEITQKDREKANNIIKDFKLSHLKLNKFGTLSQGEQRKTLLARAFMNSPSLLILDEPLTGLDPQASYDLKEAMRNHAKEGNSVLFSTHVLSVAEQLCDRIGILKKGKLIFQGSLAELKSQYPDKDLETIYLEMAGRKAEEV